MNRTFFFVFAVVTVLTGCVGKPAPPKPAIPQTPSWFGELYQPNDGNLYGVGSSQNLARAKEKALREIAAGIQISIESETKSTVQRVDTFDSNRFREDINAKVQRIEFTKPEIDRQEVIDSIYYVRMRIAVVDVINADTRRLEELNATLDDKMSRMNEASKLERFFILRKSEDEINSAISLTLRLESLYESTPFLPVNALDTVTLRRKYVDMRLLTDKLSADIRFTIDNQLPIDGFSSALAQLLGDEKLRTNTGNDSNSDAIISIKGSIQRSKIYNDFQVKANVILSIHDTNNQTFHTKNLVFSVYSPVSYEDAETRVPSSFKKTLKKEGAFDALGLR